MGMSPAELKISAVEWEDAGVYSCVAKEMGKDASDGPTKQNIALNILGKISKNAITVSIFVFIFLNFTPAAPKQTDTRENGKGQVGSTSEMSCSFKAKPLPEIKWLRFGSPIEEDQMKYELSTEKKSDIEIKSYLKILR